jgi:transcriptional regulator with XRE-family HTH domain
MEEMLNDRLKALLKKNHWSQKEFAQKAGLTECAVSNYLSGARTPQAETLVALAHLFCVSSDYLLGMENAPKEENYQKIYEMIERNKASFTAEEKIKLISLLSL